MKRTRMNVLIVTMLILCAALSMGCIDRSTDDSDTLDSLADVLVEEPTLFVKDQYDDTKYLKYTLVSMNVTTMYLGLIIESMEIYDFERLEVSGKRLQAHCTITLKELSEFNISPALQPSNEEYTMYFESMYQAGQQFEKAGKYHDIKYIDQALESVGEALDHLERSNTLLFVANW